MFSWEFDKRELGTQKMDRTCSVNHVKHLLFSGAATQLNKNGNCSNLVTPPLLGDKYLQQDSPGGGFNF